MSIFDAFSQGLSMMMDLRVLLSTLVFSFLMYKMPFWRKKVPPYPARIPGPQPAPTSGVPGGTKPQGPSTAGASPPAKPQGVPPAPAAGAPVPAKSQGAPAGPTTASAQPSVTANPPKPPPNPTGSPPPSLLRKLASHLISKTKYFFTNFILYSLTLVLYLFIVTPVVVKPSQSEDFTLTMNYFQTSWLGATLIMVVLRLFTVIPKVGKFFNDLHILTFFSAIPIMMALYNPGPLSNVLTVLPFLFFVHPIPAGILLILLKIGTFLREKIAHAMGKTLFLLLKWDGAKAAMLETRLASALAPFFFAGPIFALLIFIYNTQYR
jgi:hypothetical protein